MSSSVSNTSSYSDSTLQNYAVVVEGFKILEANLVQSQERLTAMQAANDDCKSQIRGLTKELTACERELAKAREV